MGSIIPERHPDIPVFDGLKPFRNDYRVDGDRWREIYDFYLEELPKQGWTADYEQAFGDHEAGSINEPGGFMSRWRKDGFDRELWIWASYNTLEDRTEVTYDKHPINTASTWIQEAPSQVCVSYATDLEDCNPITEQSRIAVLVSLINSAIDWEEAKEPRAHTSIIELGKLEVKILYEGDQEIYLVSNNGTKLMKPEHELFEAAGIVR